MVVHVVVVVNIDSGVVPMPALGVASLVVAVVVVVALAVGCSCSHDSHE